MLQTILIPVLISLVACGVLFFYFRNRMTVTENKVNLMFDLIQEHQKQADQQRAALHYQQQELMTNADMTHPQEAEPFTHASTADPELIDISEGETDSESESDSDDESNDGRLKLSDDQFDDEGNNVTCKLVKILTLAGAEIGSSGSGLKEQESPPEISTETLDDTSDIKEIILSPDIKLDTTIDDINLSDDEDVDVDDNVDDDVDEVEGDNQELTNSNTSDDDKKTIVKKVEDTLDISKMTVVQLKAQCTKEGLFGFSKMKKKGLIDLLTQNTMNVIAN